jgi:PPOX class probable FMN-dependent enzyme
VTVTPRTIRDEGELRAIVGSPSELVAGKIADRLNDLTRQFVERSPFVCVATSRPDGGLDISPRGDPAGFVRILDDRRLLIPERPGNRLADTLTNLLADPRIGLLFLIPGVGETFRVNGRAAIVDDPVLLAMAAKGRAGQPMANLIFAAAHYLLLRGAEHPLRSYYRTLTPDDALERGDPFLLFRDFCLTHACEIEELIATRVTNTNEVGRSAYLRAGFLAVAAKGGEPLHLIELGPSAGLNLHWHRYGYRYVRAGAVHVTGARGARFLLDTKLEGSLIPPMRENPQLGKYLGLERDPVDLSDPDARDWLKALIWADHMERLARLTQALEATAGLSLEIRKGDGLALLPDALADCPKDGALCLFHTLTTYQFDKPERQALDDILVLASLRRPIFRLSLEFSGGVYPLKLTRYADGAKAVRLLALCDPQGGTLEWRDEKSP